jgi:hypothetical protein
MRRIVANTLLVLLTCIPILPYLSTTSRTDLPACCQRDGKHHCTMMSAESSSGGGLQAKSEKCPLYPLATFFARNQVACPRETAIFYAGIVSHPALHAQIDANYRVSNSRSHQKRGPPPASADSLIS